MKLAIYLALIIILVAGQCCAYGASLLLADKTRAQAVIVVAPDAPSWELTAADQLADYLNRITGAQFRVFTTDQRPEGTSRIFVGKSAAARKLLKIDNWLLKPDEIIIRFVGDDLVLAGEGQRGTLYSVYTFLEDYLGCRWWTPGATYVPSSAKLLVQRKDRRYAPVFGYRELYYSSVDYQNADFASKLKLNGTVQTIPTELGGHHELIGFVHTFDLFIPASKYFKDHPEWFSLYKGKRVGGQEYGGLCLTNEEMKAEFIKNVLEAIAKNPGADMISISQNDGEGYCECENCSKIVREEQSQSGLHLRFVNSVAKAIASKYPNLMVETLAYEYTRKAPKLTRPADNVIVRLCSIECNFAKPLDDATNADFYRDLSAWKSISKNLFIWDYTVNYSNLLIWHPNWDVYAPNLRLFAKNNVVGVLAQGDGWNNGAAFQSMKTWVLSKLLWNPRLDTRKLMREFADGYYGAAGKYMYSVIDITAAALTKSGLPLLTFAGNNINYLGQREMDRAEAAFDKAQGAVADAPELLDRVKVERLALQHTWILHTSLNRQHAGMEYLCEDFISRSLATKNIYINENVPMNEGYFAGLRSYASIPYISPEVRKKSRPVAVKGLKAEQWIELQDNKITIYMPGIKGFPTADKEASDGGAIRMPGNQLDWACQMFVDQSAWALGTQVDVYVSVRAALKSDSGTVFTAGIYDNVNFRYISELLFDTSQVKDSQYHDYYLGRCTIGPGVFAYVASPGEDGASQEVLVDRGFLIER